MGAKRLPAWEHHGVRDCGSRSVSNRHLPEVWVNGLGEHRLRSVPRSYVAKKWGNAMNKIDLWSAINHYCVACGGSPATRIYGNVERQRAVVAVEKAICAMTENAMRMVADAARDLLAVTGEIDDNGAFQGCPQSSLTASSREEIAPWVEGNWRALSALVGCVGMRTLPCRGCGGDGQTAQDVPARCPVCNGSGVEVSE
jgi:hypothetical protein